MTPLIIETSANVVVRNMQRVGNRNTGGVLVIKRGKGQPDLIVEKLPRKWERIIFHCLTGYITFEAQTWLADAGIPWMCISPRNDHDRVNTVSGPRMDGNGAIARKQAMAYPGGPLEHVAHSVTRGILADKISGQADVVEDVFSDVSVAKSMRELSYKMGLASSPTEMTGIEGRAARFYWQVWRENVRVPWSPRDMLKVPSCWLKFEARKSLTKDGRVHPGHPNRHATDPVNAMLNWAYRVAETMCVQTCHATGLSPHFGLSHASMTPSTVDRAGMALDLLEILRPHCDRIVLGIMDTGHGVTPGDYLTRDVVWETPQGIVRLEPPLSTRLTLGVAKEGWRVDPHAQEIVRQLRNAAFQ